MFVHTCRVLAEIILSCHSQNTNCLRFFKCYFLFCMYLYVWRRFTHAMPCMWRPEDRWCELILCYHHIGFRGQTQVTKLGGIISLTPKPCFMRQGLPLVLKLSDAARLPQVSPRYVAIPPSQHRDCRCTMPDFFMWVSGNELRSIRLHCKKFTHRAVSPALFGFS